VETRDIIIETRQDVKWIKASITAQNLEIKEQRNQLEALKKKVYYLFGGLFAVVGAAEFLAHVKEAFKL